MGAERGRTAWRLLDDAAERKEDVILVWRLDRAFRSVRERPANTPADLRHCGVGLRLDQRPWLNTTSPFGEALYYITVAFLSVPSSSPRSRRCPGCWRSSPLANQTVC